MQGVLEKSYAETTYIFCLIGLQTLISAISSPGIHARYVGEKLRGKVLWIILIWFCQTN